MKLVSLSMLIPLALAPLTVVSCSKNSETELKIFIDGESTLKIGEHSNYNARFSIHNQTSGVQWSSSDRTILDIDANGKAVALKSGSVVIKAISLRDNSIYDLKTISIVDAPSPKYIIISGNNKIFAGTSWQQKYSVSVLPQDASQQIEWSVNTPHTTITEDGVLSVSSSSVKNITIKATSIVNPSLYSQFTVDVVRPTEPRDIEIFGSDEISLNSHWQYKAKTLPSSIESPCKWSLLDEGQENLADVDPYSGIVYAKQTGSIDLVAKSIAGNVMSTKHINIVDSQNIPNEANIIGPEILDHDSSAIYSSTINLESTSQPVIWSVSDNAEIISEKQTAIQIKAKAQNFDPIYLTATLINFPQISILKKIDNKIKPKKIDIKTPVSNEMGCNQFFCFNAMPSPQIASNDVYWTSSNPDVINIDAISGYAQSISQGTATIKCVSKMDSSVQSQATISVLNDLSIEIEGPDEIYSGTDWPYEAKISSGEVLPVCWTVSNTSIATYDESKGVLQARQQGKITLTATLIEHPDVTTTKHITIYSPVKRFSIVGDNVAPNNENTQYTVKTIPESGFPLVDWTIADGPLIASITSDGVLQPVEGKTGNVTIIATSKYDSKITAQLSVLITGDAIKVNFSPTIGKAYDMVSSTHVIKDTDYVAQFVSTQYIVDEESDDTLPIHKELKLTDIEVLCDGQLINNECTLMNNFLVVPKQYINENHSITINILGGEIADWINWTDISGIADKDLSDDPKDTPIEEQTQIVKDYFQIGDYKKAYETGGDVPYKFYATARLESFYTCIFQIANEDMEIENKYAPMQFEFVELVGKAKYDENEPIIEPGLRYYLIDKWWNLPIDEDLMWPPQIKLDICNKLSLDGISPRSICLDPKYDEREAPSNDSTFYLMDTEEYNFPLSDDIIDFDYRWIGFLEEEHQGKLTHEWNPYQFYSDSYITIKTLNERRAKPSIEISNLSEENGSWNWNDGYLTRRILQLHSRVYPRPNPQYNSYVDAPVCVTFDGSQLYSIYERSAEYPSTQLSGNYVMYNLAFSF